MNINILIVSILAITLYGCGGGSSGTASTTVVGLSVPAGADLITDNTGVASSLTSSVASGYSSAYSDAGTDYSNATVRSQVYIGRAGWPMSDVDIILCIINKTAQSTIVNGNYLAVLDLNLCNSSGSNEPNMVNMIVDTSRASNTSHQMSKVLFESKQNGISYFTQADTVVEKEPTSSAPYGQLRLDYAASNPSPVYISQGSLVITGAGDKVSIELVQETDQRNKCGSCDVNSASTPYHDSNYISYIDAHTSSDGSSGMAKVGYVDRSDSSKKLTYLLNWNSEFIAQHDYDTNDALLQTTCKSRTSYLNSVTNYELFNTSGSRVSITTHVFGHYTDASNNKKRIYVGKRNAWFEGGETGSNRPSSMTTSDGTILGISYDAGDSSTSNYDTDNDGVFATVTGITLSDPIRFTNAVISGSNVVYNDGTTQGTNYTPSYLGSDGKRSWGIPSVTVSGNSMRKLNINNGTQLTDMNGVSYILKQDFILKYPSVVSISNCSSLTAEEVNAETNISAKTSADITAIDASWVTPVVGDNPKVIDGVIQ